MAKERPILFSTPMVQAILSNRKLQTRRIVKPQPESMDSKLPIPVADFVKDLENKASKGLVNLSSRGSTKGMAIPDCPYGEIGDLLYVREKFLYDDGEGIHWYAASMDKSDVNYLKGSWTPSIHMPKSAARIWLEITDIKIERLKHLSEEESLLEGIDSIEYKGKSFGFEGGNKTGYGTAKGAFSALWNLINGEGSWDLNPWVWVITFKKVAKP